MTLADLQVNVSVREEDAKRLKAQTWRVFNRLNNRILPKVSTGELAEMAPQYNARIFEIRKFLKDYGYTVKRFHVKDGNNYYMIARS
jgi:hypothetical protein